MPKYNRSRPITPKPKDKPTSPTIKKRDHRNPKPKQKWVELALYKDLGMVSKYPRIRVMDHGDKFCIQMKEGFWSMWSHLGIYTVPLVFVRYIFDTEAQATEYISLWKYHNLNRRTTTDGKPREIVPTDMSKGGYTPHELFTDLHGNKESKIND